MKPCTGCGRSAPTENRPAVAAPKSAMEWKHVSAIEAEGERREPGYAAAILSRANVREDVAIFPTAWREQCWLDFPLK